MLFLAEPPAEQYLRFSLFFPRTKSLQKLLEFCGEKAYNWKRRGGLIFFSCFFPFAQEGYTPFRSKSQGGVCKVFGSALLALHSNEINLAPAMHSLRIVGALLFYIGSADGTAAAIPFCKICERLYCALKRRGLVIPNTGQVRLHPIRCEMFKIMHIYTR